MASWDLEGDRKVEEVAENLEQTRRTRTKEDQEKEKERTGRGGFLTDYETRHSPNNKSVFLFVFVYVLRLRERLLQIFLFFFICDVVAAADG